MDFEFSDDQEQLRDSVRRFLADRAPVAGYVRPLLDGADEPPARGVERARRARCRRAARARGARRVGRAGRGNRNGRRRGGARGDGPGRASRARTSRRRSARSRSCSGRAPREHAFLLPGMATGSVVGTVALLEPGRRFEIDAPTTTAKRLGEGWVLDGVKVHVPDAVGSDVVLVTASVAGEAGTAVFAVQTGSGGVTVEPVKTVDGTRKQATITFDGAPGWRLGGRRRVGGGRPHGRPHGRRVGDRRRRRGATRARARGRVREGTGRVRPADRVVPGRAAPVRRHAARSSSVAPRATTRAGPPTTPTRPKRTAPPRWRRRSRATRSRSSAAARSRCSAASASRGSTTSTCTTSACSRSRTRSARADDALEELAAVVLAGVWWRCRKSVEESARRRRQSRRQSTAITAAAIYFSFVPSRPVLP